MEGVLETKQKIVLHVSICDSIHFGQTALCSWILQESGFMCKCNIL